MAAAVVIVFIALVAYLLPKMFFFFRDLRYKMKMAENIPGPKVIPFVGNTLSMIGETNDISRFLCKSAQEVVANGGNTMRIWLFNRLLVIPLTGEAAKGLLDSNEEIVKGSDYNFLLPWLGTGLLISTGKKWHARRKMLTPTFHFSMLDGYVSTFDEQARVLVSHLDEKVGTELDIFPYIKRCALDIICETAMGIEMGAQADPNNPYVLAVGRMNLLLMQHMFQFWLWFPPIWWLTGKKKVHAESLKTLTDFTKKVIHERSEAYRRGDVQPRVGNKKCFLDMLIEMNTKGELSEEDIREEVDTFMFEGHDTTSSGMAWIVFCLAAHPDIQEKVYAELHSVFGDSDRECRVEDLKNLPYLERCIKESMRIYPPVPMVQRMLQNDFKIGDHIAPKGAEAIMSMILIQNNSKTFKDPQKFNPDNFLPENISKRHAYDYMPFSAGPRNCIGQRFAQYEEKMVVSWILRKFKLSTSIPFESNERCPEVVLRPKFGATVKLERRE